MPTFSQSWKALLPLGGAIVSAGIAGFLFYKLFQKDEEIEELSLQELNRIREHQLAKLEIKIPKNAVGAVIGRQGSNIKHIQDKTSTAIHFRDDDENERTCIIQGKREKAEKAKELILKAVEDVPVFNTFELRVPAQAIGRIIGKGGDTVHNIQRTSGARVKVCSEEESLDTDSEGLFCESTRKVLIKGTSEQVALAKNSIMEKVEEDEEMRKKIKKSVSHISRRSKTRHQNGTVNSINDTDYLPQENDNVKFPISMSSKTYTEAFVSAVESASHFWVQVVGSKTVELDDLVSEMTDYYADPKTRELHQLSNVIPGDIVAAKFPSDNMWYRGRICESMGAPEHPQYDIYFVDFGDSDVVECENICELRTDFLKLSFQAIECYLANIDPASADTPEALQTFEKLVYATQWKPVMVRILGYKQEGNDTLPCVKVIDTSGPEDVDVAETLVQRGLASWAEERTSLSSSMASLNDNWSI